MTSLVIPQLTVEGYDVVAPTTVYSPENGASKGYPPRTATLNAQNIWDEPLATGIYLFGGGCWVRNATQGDYGELAVVDKDDVLGLFAYYGLIKGVDVLELRKHLRTHYFPVGASELAMEYRS